MSERSLFLVSSADSQRFDNKLSNFVNLFSRDITRTPKNYYLAVAEVFLDDSFKASFNPKSDHLAPIICTKLPFPDSGIIDENAYKDLPAESKIFLQSKNYPSRIDFLQALAESQSSNMRVYKKFPKIWCQNLDKEAFFGAFQSNKSAQSFETDEPYFVYVFKPLAELCAETIEASNQLQVNREVSINGFRYKAYETDDNTGIAFKLKDKFDLKSYFEPLFFVEVSICNPVRMNETLVPYIFNATLEHERQYDSDEVERYQVFHHEVKHKLYHKIRGDTIRSIRVRIVDKNGDPLMLNRGRSTIIHLSLREEDEDMRNQFMITVTSEKSAAFPNNNNNEFSTNIFPAIRFPENSEWECSLVSCSVPTRYNLPIAESNRCLMVSFYHPETSEYLTSGLVMYPQSIQSLQEIVSRFNEMFADDLDRAKASINVISGTLEFRSEKYTMDISIRADFYKLLGGKMTEEYDPDFVHHLTRPRRVSYVFPGQPNFHYYFPGTLFCYFGSIEPVFIGNDQYPILRILQTKFSNYRSNSSTMSHMHTFTFDSLLFHKVSQNLITRMDFSINTQDGKNANFVNYENSPTVLNLLFRRIQK